MAAVAVATAVMTALLMLMLMLMLVVVEADVAVRKKCWVHALKYLLLDDGRLKHSLLDATMVCQRTRLTEWPVVSTALDFRVMQT